MSSQAAARADTFFQVWLLRKLCCSATHRPRSPSSLQAVHSIAELLRPHALCPSRATCPTIHPAPRCACPASCGPGTAAYAQRGYALDASGRRPCSAWAAMLPDRLSSQPIRLGIRTAILNPDAIPGRANRHLAHHADLVVLQWDVSRAHFPANTRCQVLGCPIRASFAIPDPAEGRRRFELDETRARCPGHRCLSGRTHDQPGHDARLARLPRRPPGMATPASHRRGRRARRACRVCGRLAHPLTS